MSIHSGNKTFKKVKRLNFEAFYICTFKSICYSDSNQVKGSGDVSLAINVAIPLT